MKQLIFILTFLFIFNSIFGQSRIGFSEYDIKHKEFPFKTFVTKYSDDGTKYMFTEDEFSVDYYFFDKESICDVCFIHPKTQIGLNAMVETFNKTYVIISPTEWRMYLNNGVILKCGLTNIEGDNFFVIKEQ